MIEGMVSRLATRLDAEGGSAEEYIRLARSYVVLGRRDDAVRAMESGLAAFADEPEAQASLREAAGELGLSIN
jgi:cytochrome c-type biogenesis protein CcmH